MRTSVRECPTCRQFVRITLFKYHALVCRKRKVSLENARDVTTKRRQYGDWNNRTVVANGRRSDSASEDESAVQHDMEQYDLQSPVEDDESEVDDDLADSTPRTHKEKLNHMLFCFLYFLLLWKVMNFVSNNAFEEELRMLKKNFSVMSADFKAVAALMPTTLFAVLQRLQVDRDGDYVRMVPCSACHHLYPERNVINAAGMVNKMRCDELIEGERRQPTRCGNRLVKQVFGKRPIYVPRYVYLVSNVAQKLQNQLRRPGYESLCRQWNTRTAGDDVIADIYDGNVWKNLQSRQGIRNANFLNQPNTYGLMLNLDWFQPYDKRKNSVGMMYLANMNLPRELRHKRENVIVLAIIPDFDHEPSNIETYLDPIVDQLNSLWHPGVNIATNEHPDGVTVKAAVVCTSADVPATRKLSGFLGHNAIYGCTKCKHRFSGGVGNKNYSGFQKHLWPKRTYVGHKQSVQQIKAARTATERKRLESSCGYRYTPLMKLPYFDSIHMTAIDPMHCLFEGVAKTVFRLWRENGTLTDRKMAQLDEKMERINASTKIGTLPRRLSLRTKLTAAEWKAWTLNYSLILLHGLIPEEKLKNWQTFVKVCRLITKPVVSKRQLTLIDALFLKFGRDFSAIYGDRSVTPNMHFACHLTDCVLDLGPVYSFWLFSFERNNGLMGRFKSNGRDIATILMRNMTLEGNVYRVGYRFKRECAEFDELFETWTQVTKSMAIDVKRGMLELYAMTRLSTRQCSGYWAKLDSVRVLGKPKLIHLDQDDVSLLHSTYSVLYPDEIIRIEDLCTFAHETKSVEVGGELFSSTEDSRRHRYSRVVASWFDPSGGICSDNMSFRPGSVKRYIQHNIKINGERKTYVLAVVKWNCPYPYDLGYLDPVSVYYGKRYEDATLATFVPVQRLCCQYLSEERTISNDNVLAVIPVERNWYL